MSQPTATTVPSIASVLVAVVSAATFAAVLLVLTAVGVRLFASGRSTSLTVTVMAAVTLAGTGTASWLSQPMLERLAGRLAGGSEHRS